MHHVSNLAISLISVYSMRRLRKFEAFAIAFFNWRAKKSGSPSKLQVLTKEILVSEKVNMHLEKSEKSLIVML